MTILVPFDGSDLSESALVRAVALGEAFGESVLALTVVPEDNTKYARDHSWLDSEESFDRQTVVGRLHEHATTVAPEADFRHEVVDKFASSGSIASKIRHVAKEVDASMVVIGSDNAGRMVSSIHSVGSTVAADDAFDVLIVRRPVSADSLSSSGW